MRQGLPAQPRGSEWRFSRDAVLAWAGGNTPGVVTAGSSTATPHDPTEGPPRPTLCPSLLAARGDIVIEVLLAHCNRRGPELLGYVQANRGQALPLLEANRVLAAGCHGDPPPVRFGSVRLARVQLCHREVGLCVRPGTLDPTIQHAQGSRFASHPSTAGILVHYRAAAASSGLDADLLLAGAQIWDTHGEVACAVVRGHADIGLSTRAWADRAGLEFRVLATESYGLLVRSDMLGDVRVVQLCETAQSPAFHDHLRSIAGYDPAGAGDIRYDREAPG